MELGICRLCKEWKLLCNQSHIIPNFLYKELKVEEGHFFKLETMSEAFNTRGKFQTGIFEKNILCENCDNNIISKLERYGSQVFNGTLKLNIIDSSIKGLRMFEIQGIEYNTFKLFILSILWRSSLSNNEFFRNVILGPYEETLRTMILGNNAGNENDFPFLAIAYTDEKIKSGLIAQPRKSRVNSGTTYTLLFGGISYTIFISKHIYPDFIPKLTIKNDNKLKIIIADDSIRRLILNSMTGLKIF
jgi:hypothetical protein